jgi:hypothetical protein
VISRANLLALFYFRAFGCQPSRALRREKKRRDVMNSQKQTKSPIAWLITVLARRVSGQTPNRAGRKN